METAPYGSWRSPITAELIARGSLRLGQIVTEGERVYWTETRPAEGGRVAVVAAEADGGPPTEVLPAPHAARTRAHEYGGGAFTVARGTLYFTSWADQRVHRLAPGTGDPVPLTPDDACCYADLVVDARRGRVLAVAEDHGAGADEAAARLVAIDVARSGSRPLVAGADFYSSPRPSPDGRHLAWLQWSHPDMPWDASELWVADVRRDGAVGAAARIAGGGDESIFQPEWSPDGVLHFTSDRSGWWNLYAWRDGDARPLCPRAAEFGVPQWLFGMSTYAFVGSERIACAFAEEGWWRLGVLARGDGRFETRPLPYSDVSSVRATSRGVAFVGAGPTTAPEVVHLDLETGARTVLRRSSELTVDPGALAAPQAIRFAVGDGLDAHAFHYPPRNPRHQAPAGARPPLLVLGHGGPTAQATTALDLRVQFWTSRGVAVVAVNYRGSSGYGRRYRRALDGGWGVADVDDCEHAARFLAAEGAADPARLVISGTSAGGFTVLCALTFRDTFAAGASWYGIADLEALAADTHKFESRYTDRLVAPYPAGRDVYRARSPLHHVERLARPVIFLQGSDDRVVPPAQAERMVAALRARGLPVACVLFEGEQHGFRRADTIRRALEAELAFYGRVLGFTPADALPAVTIENLPAS